MSATIEGRAEELLTAKNFCNVAASAATEPSTAWPVWVDVQDGRPVVKQRRGRSWVRNLERDPRVTLTVRTWRTV